MKFAVRRKYGALRYLSAWDRYLEGWSEHVSDAVMFSSIHEALDRRCRLGDDYVVVGVRTPPSSFERTSDFERADFFGIANLSGDEVSWASPHPSLAGCGGDVPVPECRFMSLSSAVKRLNSIERSIEDNGGRSLRFNIVGFVESEEYEEVPLEDCIRSD